MTERLSRLSTVALIGMSRLLDIRNSSTNVIAKANAATSGTRSIRVVRKSVSSAGNPPTTTRSNGAGVARIRPTSCDTSVPARTSRVGMASSRVPAGLVSR